ncbi:MAG: CPBP family intramembrane metalloprotease [Clostridia bacterium]|nr:CPBP family intramembrane metalloprotease [Clostridia bacterium]
MENKKGLFAGFHRDGYTWKDSMIVSILVFFMMFFVGTGIAMPIGMIFNLFSNEGNAEFLTILEANFGFLGYWIIAFIYLSLVKSDKPILRAFGREPRGNTVKMALWGLPVGLGLNALCVGIAVFHGDIQLSFSSFPVLKLLLVFLSVFVQSGGEELLCRGVLYQRLRKGYRNPWVAILINPIVFMLMHSLIPGITIWAVLSIYVAGVMFSLMVYYLDSLWMAMAAHAAWNFTQNFIFGLPNSGTVYDFSIFKLNSATARTSLCYNVAFGVEASMTAVLVLAFAVAILICLGRKKNQKSLDVWES